MPSPLSTPRATIPSTTNTLSIAALFSNKTEPLPLAEWRQLAA